MLNSVSKLTRFNFLVAILLLVLFGVYRLVFWLVFTDDNSQLEGILYGFYLGLKFDWRLAILVVLPILLIGWTPWTNPFKNTIAAKVVRIYLTSIFTLLVLLYFIDFGHYSYLKYHINKGVLRFLENFDISATMMWQSYPILWLGLLLLILIVVFNKIVYKIWTIINHQDDYKLSLPKKIIVNTLIVILIFFSLLAKLSWYPLRWSDAYASGNSLVADIAQNPILYGYDTLRYADIDYDIDQAKQSYPRLKDYLKLADNKPLDFKRKLILTPKISTNANVVFVFLESFAAYKTGVFGNPLNSSPNFDKLTKNSLFFDRFYVAHTGTARSVFANIAGLIDTQTLKTATRNPLIVNKNTLINAFRGYNKFYFLGGSANWGNIRGLLANNIPKLTIYEAGSYHSKRQDVWGISDADLLLESSKILKQKKEPFLAIIQTSGNHRPYTIPEPNYGFKPLHLKTKQVKKYGFNSLEELNSFRFMDHSIGLFIKQAKIDGYYDNTVFVFFADHGINANNGLHSANISTKLNLGSYHIPLIIHAPKFIKPSVNNTVASQIDMLAIVAGLMNKPYINTGLGRNMLAKKYQNQQFSFLIDYGVIPNIGIIGKDFLFRMRADNTHLRLYDLNNLKHAKNISTEQLETTKYMQELTNAIYQSNKYLLYYNE